MSNLDYEINKELGECYLFMGEIDKAEEYYTKAVNSNGSHADPYLGLATIALQRGELDQAHTLYGKAAGIKAEDKSLAGLAMVEMELGRHEEGFAHYRQALQHNPQNLIAMLGLIQAAHVLNLLEDILPAMEDFLQLEPDRQEVRFALAGCLVSLGKGQEAVPHLERILQQNPDNSQARELLDRLG